MDWSVPFKDVAHVLVALPEDLIKIASGAEAAAGDLPKVAASLVSLLTDASIAITDKGLNFTVDSAVAKDFLATLAQLKTLVGDVAKA